MDPLPSIWLVLLVQPGAHRPPIQIQTAISADESRQPHEQRA
jgi:hypothetical protein